MRFAEPILLWALAALPLVASRLHLVVRQGLAGFTQDGNGVLLLQDVGWVEARDVP